LLQVNNSPFTQQQIEWLNALLPTLTEGQRQWLSGYLAALGAAGQAAGAAGAQALAGAGGVQAAATGIAPAALAGAPMAPAAAAPAEPKEATVLFGSQTGNGQRLAGQLAKKLEGAGWSVTLRSMRDFKPNQLKNVRNLFIVVSTHGDGDPPDNAVSFYEFLHGKRAPQLPDTRFAVLALGDTSYDKFCQTGKDFDKRLEELGAQRLVPRVDCDVDYDEAAAGWMERVLEALGRLQAESAGSAPGAISSGAVAQVAVAAGTAAAAWSVPAPSAEPAYSRSNPFLAEVVDNINLNGRGSDRETRHLVLSLEGSGLVYEPGDAVAIFPENDPRLVDAVIEAGGWSPEAKVEAGKSGTLPLREALLRHFEMTVLTRPLVAQIAELAGSRKLKELVAPGNEEAFKAYADGRDLLDLLQDFGLAGLPAADFVKLLRKMPARQYSIASSQLAHPDEVFLTIRKVEYERHGRRRTGVCSGYVAERLEPGDRVPIYIHQNPNFKLPADPLAPIIMIGPGTGVAPFRAFIEEREETGAGGKSWLFYGDRRFRTDFLYQTEWQRWLASGALTRMDVAFSRDAPEKVYVQHRMLERSRELYAWIEEGAVIYVCGDEKRMARDVEEALVSIIAREGGKSRIEAESVLADLKAQNRYQRDVY
jgi:sulfite reductase (NADPH) flavoprotein alpha-component